VTSIGSLLAHPDVTEEVRLTGPVGLMALHGGIEAHTADMAREIAGRAGASLYVVEQPPELSWHVPSVEYGRERSSGLASFLEHCTTVVSLHGFGRPGLRRTVLVGGRNVQFGAAIAARIRAASSLRVIDDIDAIPSGLRGHHPANPVNQARSAGVQLEMSAGARMRPHRPRVVTALADSIGRYSP
jgi:phage replication-related protein YjqB (UPF0714/DUF867 family)